MRKENGVRGVIRQSHISGAAYAQRLACRAAAVFIISLSSQCLLLFPLEEGETGPFIRHTGSLNCCHFSEAYGSNPELEFLFFRSFIHFFSRRPPRDCPLPSPTLVVD